MDNDDDKPMPTGPYIWPGHTEPTPQKLTPSEANAVLEAWRAAFPEGARYGEQVELALQPKVRYAEKGSALDRASRLWGCAWLVKGRKQR